MEKDFEREVLERLARIETKLDDYDGIKSKAENGFTLAKSNEKDIKELQDKLTWVSRTLIGALLTGGIGLVFAFLKMKL